MNTLLHVRPSALDVSARQALPVRRLTLADRIALRVGLTLVLWARRPLAEEPLVLQRRAQAAAAAEARRDAAHRMHRLLIPQR